MLPENLYVKHGIIEELRKLYNLGQPLYGHYLLDINEFNVFSVITPTHGMKQGKLVRAEVSIIFYPKLIVF